MKHNKTFKSRFAACTGALVLTAYSMTEVLSAAAFSAPGSTAPTTPAAYVPAEQQQAAEDTGIAEEIAALPEADTPYEELSEEARRALAEDNIPVAGYSEYTEDELEAFRQALPERAAVRKGEGEGEGEGGGSASEAPIDWDEIVDRTYVPANAAADNPLNSFSATYSGDIQQSNGQDTDEFLYREQDFTVKYTVSLNTKQPVDAGNAVITIPGELLKYRDGSSVRIRTEDGIALPLYSVAPVKNPDGSTALYSGGEIVKSNRTQFGYYIDEDGNYVIVNYSAIKPGVTWFEVVYDPVSVFEVTDGKNNDAADGTNTWELRPEIQIQYAFEKQCQVFVGYTPEEASDDWTLHSGIMSNWQEYMSPTWEEDYRYMLSEGNDLFGGTRVYADRNAVYFAVDNLRGALDDYKADPANGWDNSLGVLDYLLYTKDADGQPVLTYRAYSTVEFVDSKWTIVEHYQRYNETDGIWEDVPVVDEPKVAVRDAAKYIKNGETYYEVLNTQTVSNQAVSVYTYYDSEGKPQYQKKVAADGTTVYQKAEENAWVPCDASELPVNQWEYATYTKESKPLTGLVNTEAKLDEVSKKVGEVTQSVYGNLNSVEQILSFIPEADRSAISPQLHLDDNIYVLWEIDLSGADCTQPFRLFLDEYTSYSTGAVDQEQQPLTYLYFDEASGTVQQNTEGSSEYVPGGRIVYIEGSNVDSISGYTPVHGEESTLYYIGSAVSDEIDGNAVLADQNLRTAGTNGKYSKKITVISEYPRGNSNSEGVAIDTVIADEAGAYVYIPAGAHMDGITPHDLWTAVNNALKAEDRVPEGQGILADRKTVKQVLNNILDEELAASDSEVSPLIRDFVTELANSLPNVPALAEKFAGKTLEEREAYIISCWKDGDTSAEGKQIKKALQDYLDEILDENLKKLNVKVGNTSAPLQSYDKKKVYREVKNEVNAVVVPIDQKDPIITEDSYAVLQREDRDPSVPNGFTHTKTANGGKSGWIDMYDATADPLFGSTFTFDINAKATTFEETHPRSSAYFYDNASYVKLVLADDILTAEPFGTDKRGNQLYGGSYVLGPDDYCYTAAKIVVNEEIFNIVDDSSKKGATTADTGTFLIDQAGSPIDRDWHIYVSYDGSTWEEYAQKITMEDYLSDSANYDSSTKGKHVLTLDFTKDAQQPCRIKVEHNTIDYLSTVSMSLTAAIKKDSALLKKPTGSTGSLREHIYSTADDSRSFGSESPTDIDVFRIRFHNYAGFYAQSGTLSEADGVITAKPGDFLTSGKQEQYQLLNRPSVEGNTNILSGDKLTDDYIPVDAFGGVSESYIERMDRAVEVSKLEKASLAEKTSTYANDLTHGRANITYRIAGYEGYLLDNSYKQQISLLDGYSMIPGEDRSTLYIYDLLPPGVEFEGYSGANEKPFAGYLTSKASITDSSKWTGTDKISVSAEVISEDSPEWASWGGAENGDGRYLVKFTLTLEDADQYDLVDNGNWFWGVGIQFRANVSWERYTAAKNTPNLAVYVTPTETIGKHDNRSVYQDNGAAVPGDDYKPFKNTTDDTNKEDFNGDNATDDYCRMYAKSKDLGEIARASSTAVGKLVRSDADTYALFTEKTAVIKSENYTYNVNVENQAGGAVSGIILYDWLESAGNADETWKGLFRAVDTSALILNQSYPVVYYYTGTNLSRDAEGRLDQLPYPQQSTGAAAVLPSAAEWTAKGWETDPADKSKVQAIAIALYADSAHTVPYTLNGKETLSYKISMKAPAKVDSGRMYAVNRPNYCYVKVETSVDPETPWVVQSDDDYYDDPGNRTVVLIGDRRMLKVAKHVESNFSNSASVQELGGDEELEFTFRLTRYTGYYENDVWKEGDVPCANVQYRIYNCTFKKDGTEAKSDVIDRLGEEVDQGIIHTTNENGEFILKDGQCAVFQYVPSTAGLVSGADERYDFDNYKVTELSKPFWYEFKSIDKTTTDQWYSGDSVSTAAPADGVTEEDAYTGTAKYYKQTGLTVTNTYRPVIYISKDTVSVPDDLPTTDNLSAEAAAAKIEAFNTFDFNLWLYEYPINRITGKYFQNGDYLAENDDDGDGLDADGHKAAWLQLREYYDSIGSDAEATAGESYFAQINRKIAALNEALDALDPNDTAQQAQINQKQREIEAWQKLKAALAEDKALLDAHIAAAVAQGKTLFAAPQEDADGTWVGSGYLYRTVSDRLILPITGYAKDPSGTIKSFSNSISAKDDRQDGAYLYTYTVGSTAHIYSTPDGWIGWEDSDAANRNTVHAANNPITVQVRAGTVVALPIYLAGGMMYSDFGIGDASDPDAWSELQQTAYLQRYCYQFQEAMDNKYWNDTTGRYETIANPEQYASEKSWEVQTPSENRMQKNTLGAYGENFLDYDNNYRFKDIYLQKSVEPAEHVPKGDETNSVEKTAFIYKVTRRDVNAAPDAGFEDIPTNIRSRMTWELWTRDADGTLLEKQLVGPVNSDGMILAPIANYTGADTLYTIKIRNAEVGYTYRVEEVMGYDALFGSGYAAKTEAEQQSARSAAVAEKFPYVTYQAASNTFTYKKTGADAVTLISADADRTYLLATEALYAVDGTQTSGALKIYDNDSITATLAKVDMTVDNVYRLRDLTVKKSIVARTVDSEMAFTVRVRRKDLGSFSPTGLRFYRMENGEKVYLNAAQVKALQGNDALPVTDVKETVTNADSTTAEVFRYASYVPAVQYYDGASAGTAEQQKYGTVGYYYLEFRLKNGCYAEIVDIGYEKDEYQIAEEDWPNMNTEGYYIHLDPPDDAATGLSQWKSAELSDNTSLEVRNGDEGYMILSKTYVSDGAGDYDEYAKSLLQTGNDRKVTLKLELGEKNSGSGLSAPTIPEGYVTISGSGAGTPVTDLSKIELKGGQTVIINLKGLCEEVLHYNYNNVEYEVTETIPEDIRFFSNPAADVLYSVEQLTAAEDMKGDKEKTSVDVQNQVTKYSSIIYKRLGGNSSWAPPQRIAGDLVLQLSDGGGNGRQQGVKWIATGKTFDPEQLSGNYGVTDETGTLTVHSFDGWSNAADGNLTYYVKVYFNETVECNLTRSDNAQVLEVQEDPEQSGDGWGYLIGYETYGNSDTYVSQSALEDMTQWHRKQDTIVNTVQTVSQKKVEVYKQVYPADGTLTDEDKDTEFTFTVKQWVNGAYVPAADIAYTVQGVEGSFKTGSDGSFKLRHGQTAELDLPMFAYWEITETGKGDYRLLVDDNGEIVYDKGTQYVLDSGLDGLAPDSTAADPATYNAQRAASGFTLHTDFDIRVGIPLGTPVVLRRGTWDATSQAYSFVLYDESQDDTSESTYYSTSSTQALYYQNDRTYSNDTYKIDKSKVRDGVIYADANLTVPIWYDTTNTSIPQTTKDAVTNYWKGEVTIPENIFYYEPSGKIYKHPVVGIGSWAFNKNNGNNTDITSVTIPKTVRKIGKKAFYKCTTLTTLNLPPSGAASLLSIGESAFEFTKIKVFNIPEGVVEIGLKGLKAQISDSKGFQYYLPKTLIHCSANALFGDETNANRCKGIMVLNSGLNNSDSISARSGNPSDFFYYYSQSSPIRPGILVLNNIKTIPTKAFCDNGQRVRHTRIIIFPKDDENGTVNVDDSIFYQNQGYTEDFGDQLRHLIVWRSSAINGSGTGQSGRVFMGTGTNTGYNRNMTYIFSAIESTNTTKISEIKNRFAISTLTLSTISINNHEVSYYSCKDVNNYDVNIIFKDQMNLFTAEDIYELGGFGASKNYVDNVSAKQSNFTSLSDPEIRSQITEILEDCGCRTTAPSYPAPPVHTNRTAYTYLAEALWLNDKKKSA